MTSFISWYLLVLLFGLVGFPIAYRLLPGLPDRGYALSKALGLLLVGYVLWISATFQLLSNTLGGIIIAGVVVAGIGWWLASDHSTKAERIGIYQWGRDNWQIILGTEVIFLLTFAGWALVRAHSPEIQYTEKPMELAFLSGVRASETFPPQDPWLSGYSISYYYFGYVIISMLTIVSDVPTEVGFNLGIALLFGLTAAGSYGLIYNLVTAYWSDKGRDARAVAALTAIIAPIFTVLVGNLMGFVDVIYSRAWLPDSFWRWLDIAEVDSRPINADWPPPEVRPGWWWWRASRVIRERMPNGEAVGIQPIDEFPMFSFILGDMHPHVLILPFIMVAIILAFNALRQKNALHAKQIGLYAVVFGSLAFFNAWDFPIYGFVLGGALVIRLRVDQPNATIEQFRHPILQTMGILAIGVLLYLPWYISFSSQAGGVLPNLLIATPFQQFFVMYGVFLPLILLFIITLLADKQVRPNITFGAAVSSSLLLSLIVVAVGFGLVLINTDIGLRSYVFQATGLPDALTNNAAQEATMNALRITFRHRLANPVTPLVLTLLLGSIIALIFSRQTEAESKQLPHNLGKPTLFVLLLIGTGTLLTLGPEFVYLRDNFGQRINTIFKFYYAAWLLFAAGTAYAVHLLIAHRKSAIGVASLGLALLLVGAGLLYPAWGIPNRTANFAGPPTLNGLAYMEQSSPAELEVIAWLRDNAQPDDVIVEAVGGAYSDFGRIASATGLQTIIGWDNHQRQWRGDTYDEAAGGRTDDVKEIYSTTSMEQAQVLLDQYDVRYIIVGPRERRTDVSTLGGLQKFEQFYKPVFQNEGFIIYQTNTRVITEMVVQE